MRKTKVICTIGPATSSREGLKSLIDAGMDVCRLNFSHGTHADHEKVILAIKELRETIEKPLAILLDTKGPEVRTKNTYPLDLKQGTFISLQGTAQEEGILISPGSIIKDLIVGTTVLFDDGSIKGEVTELKNGKAVIKILTPGLLKPNKSVNFPGIKLDIPFLPQKDKEDILFGVKMGVEAIAASFTMSAEHILSIKELLRLADAPEVLVFAKIESLEGIANFDEILEVSDGIMVARGDLAVECSFAQVPPMQKMMINKCNLKGKPVIVATQMLETMVTSATPTRAEVSDVANSVFDGTSCTMLSAETAMGKHPSHTLSVMCEIITEAEKVLLEARKGTDDSKSITSKIAISAVEMANDLNAAAILVFSKSGNTARKIASFRPRSTVIVITPHQKIYHQSAFLYGAISMKETEHHNHKNFYPFMSLILQKGVANYGDLVVVTMGVPYGLSYTTNSIRIESIGNAIVRGLPMKDGKKAVVGKVIYFFPRGGRDTFDCKGKIVITSEFFKDNELLQEALGIILQNAPIDTLSEETLSQFSKKYNIPYIHLADGAMSLLKEGEEVRLEPSLGLVFKKDEMSKEQMLGLKS